ncbi:PKD domain-containing protein [Flavobacterium sp.]|uniref:PKD domain-containing protein n=1 Tax=Flavobacterium sp. TaxID=239 RepID=UPI004048205F
MSIKNTITTMFFFFLGIVLLQAQTIPDAAFTASPVVGNSTPHTVFFTDQSVIPDTWLWNFGDGGTSTAQNPIHSYTSYGEYTVRLTIEDTMTGLSDFESKVAYIKISKPVAAIDAPTFGYFGCAPLTANFIDASVANGAPIVSWLWNFGDGTTSTDQNPSHIYNTPGSYTVSLTVTDSFGNTDTGVFTNAAQAIGPNPNFEANQTLIQPNTNVTFTNTTTFGAPITSWSWNFGDGSTSSVQNPTHTYTTSADYTVSLTVSDLDGCSRTLTKTAYIKVLGCPASVTVNNDAGQCEANVLLPDFEGFTNGNAIDLDGTNDYIAAPLPTVFNNIGANSFTVEMWVTRESPTTTSRLFFAQLDSNNFATILVSLSGVPYLYIRDNSITYSVDTRTSIPVNQWTHLAFKWNATSKTITVLINGVELQNTVSGGTSSWGNDNRMTIGSRTDSAQFFNGKIDELRIWNQERNNAAIVASMNTCVSETDANLVAYYRLDEASGSTTANDATGNGYTGTLTNSDVSIAWTYGAVSCNGYATNDFTNTNNASGVYPIGNTTVTWTATNPAGNTATCTQLITVVDAENPVITCPTAITINTDLGQCTSTASIGLATATDNCGVPTVSNDAPTVFPIGDTTVTWTATDSVGNTASCTQIVTVVDAENPVITCPTAITINTDLGQCTSTASIGLATATDNCGVPTVTNDAPTAFSIGDTTVTWTATDSAGNTTTCTQLVTVIDNENPVITCPTAITINTGLGQCTSTASIGLATATDNCGVPTVSNDAPTVFSIGDTTVTWTATDSAGNTASCTQVVTVVDTELPIVQTQDITATLDATGFTTITPTMIDNGSFDNCTIASMTLDSTSFDCTNIGTPILVTLTVTDISGNMNSATALVTVEDTTGPIVITQDISVALDNSGIAMITPEMIDNGSYDACGVASMSLNLTSFTCPRLDEVQVVTLTVTDSNGNASTADAYVSFTGLDIDLDAIADSCDNELNPDITPILGISPNGDGENDTWVIENITNFPKATIEVFDRNGIKVYNTTNYQNDWKGNRNGSGELVPIGSYYFVINVFGEGSLFIKGWLYINY